MYPSKRQLALNAHCSRCLRRGHSIKFCRFPTRCLICFNYGHRAKQCLLQRKARLRWKPKSQPNSKLEWKPKIPLDWEPNRDQETCMLENNSHPPGETQASGSSTSQSSSSLHSSLPHPGDVKSPSTEILEQVLPSPPHPAAMANFACNPAPFLSFGAHVEDGWHRPMRTRMALGGEPPRRHEEYAIISLEPPPHPAHARMALTDVVNLLEQTSRSGFSLISSPH